MTDPLRREAQAIYRAERLRSNGDVDAGRLGEMADESAARFRAEVTDTPEERGALVVAQLDRELAARRRDTRTDADRGTEKLTVRLRHGYKARLRALSEDDGYSVAEWIETWVEMAESEIRGIRERPAKRRKR